MSEFLTHKIELDPTRAQERKFEQAVRASRFAYNWGLEHWNLLWIEYQKDAKKTRPTAITLNNMFNAVKKEKYSWVTLVSKYVTQRAFHNLGRAFTRYIQRKGRAPKFKTVTRAKKSFFVGDIKGELTKYRIRIPKVGMVKVKESLRWPFAIVVEGQVIKQAGRWFLCIMYKQPAKTKEVKNGKIAGVDVGITNPYTVTVKSNGSYLTERYSAPRPLKRNLKRLRRANRQLAKKKMGSRNRERAKKRLAKLHWKIANIRNDAIHKITKKICSENEVVVLETLNVEGMKKTTLAQAVSDLSFYEFRRQVGYKSKLYGNKLIELSQWFPSSKLCSNCGVKNETLKRSDKKFICPTCGYRAGRDDNASKNMVIEAEKQIKQQAEAVKAAEAGTCGSQGTVSPKG